MNNNTKIIRIINQCTIESQWASDTFKKGNVSRPK